MLVSPDWLNLFSPNVAKMHLGKTTTWRKIETGS